MERTAKSKSIDRRDAPRASEREAYETPEIVDRGRLVEIALAGTPGSGDSGPGSFVEDPLV